MSKYTFPILKVLSDGAFHSGEVLAKRFHVSRATIYQAITDAQQLGIEIFSVRGRGYRLPQPLQMLESAQVLEAIGEERQWFHFDLLNEVDSTNTYLMQHAAKGAPHATCVAAHVQTGGRGRRGRRWWSGLGGSLTFSLLWRFNGGAAALSGLSLAVGVALVRALKDIEVHDVTLKWPNDVLINGKKLAGILIELQGDMEGPSAAVIGIGINLKLNHEGLRAIDQPATDINSVTDRPVNQSYLLGRTLRHLSQVLMGFERDGFPAFKEEWQSYHAYHGKPVRMLMPNGVEVLGEVVAVADDGILMVQTPVGVQRFSAGEISLRSAY